MQTLDLISNNQTTSVTEALSGIQSKATALIGGFGTAGSGCNTP